MDEGQRDEKLGTDHSNYAHGLSEVSFLLSPEQTKSFRNTPYLVKVMGLQGRIPFSSFSLLISPFDKPHTVLISFKR